MNPITFKLGLIQFILVNTFFVTYIINGWISICKCLCVLMLIICILGAFSSLLSKRKG